ncbi:hypothetical protein EYV94_13035 [Puteibacter caeruleilacunae]|nr:hypothetical protein EYV94_13035 [Puteibacter caeruleilacunae]
MQLQKIEQFLMVGACMIGTQACSTSTPKEQSKPNIIVILADDAGYADFGFMGCDDLETPNIDRIANTGISFNDAHVTASVCSPSRAGLLTGRYQNRFGHESNLPPHNMGMDPKQHTIADALKSVGYKTAAIGKWHLGETDNYHPNNRGFDEFYGFLGGHRSYFHNKKEDITGHPHAILHNHERVDFDGYLTDVFGDKAVEYIDQFKDNPFFIFLSFNAVHVPMDATQEDLNRYKDHPRQKLAAMTWAMDRSVGKVLKKLDQENLTDNTLIFFLSDNGGSPNNQSSCLPLKGHKGNKFEGGHRVPFAMCWPNKLPATTGYNGLTSSLDIAATIASITNVEKQYTDSLDGVNLIPFLTTATNKSPHEKLYWKRDIMAASRYKNFKLIWLHNYGYKLYDLDKEINEYTDIKDQNPLLFETMKNELHSWNSQMPKAWWPEPAEWQEVNQYLFEDLMENRPPRVKSPAALKRLKAAGKL